MSSRSFARTRRLGCLALVWLAAALPGRAEGPTLDPLVLKKVKAATTHLEVALPNGSTVEGSGFFTDEPGVVLTNAHVLGMLDADSRPPVKVAVTLHSGEAESSTLPGKLLGVDRGSDLALLRVEGQILPEPLQVVPAKDLNETEQVFIFGFPLGNRLGKNITVSTSSVSSLRLENGRLKEVQVNGGMHPGNSGGPVINGKGQVVGVAVAVIRGTQINFAIPGETVHGFLNGKVVGLGAELGYKDGDHVKMPFRISVVDPLGRLQKLNLETWVGLPGQRHRPAATTAPQPQPGDSDRQAVAVDYQKRPDTLVELSLPPLADAKQVYWIQPNYVNGAGETVWYNGWAPALGAPVERREVTLRYQPPLDHTLVTELTSEGSFRMRLETEEHSLAMNQKNTLLERTAAARAGDVLPIQLVPKGFSVSMTEDNKPARRREELQRLANDTMALRADLEMEADGSVGRGKADVARVPAASRKLVESIGDQLLQGLELVAVPLPEGTVRPRQTWKVQRTVLLGSALLGVRAQANIKYTYLGTRTVNDREIAFLNVSGTVRGLRGAGLNVGGTVGGLAQVAVDTGEVLFSNLNFKADMDLDYEGNKVKLFGNMTVRVRREVPSALKPPPAPKGN